jgi:hypothetical protein
MRTRREKSSVSLPAAVDDASSSDEQQHQQQLPERKRARRGQDANRARILDGYNEGVELTDVLIEKSLAFCCFKCTCSDATRGRIPYNDKYVHSSDESLWHRRCCHGLVDPPSEDWLSPSDQALLDAEPTEENYHLLGQKNSDEKPYDMGVLRQKVMTAKTQESEMHNEDELEGTCFVLIQHENFRILPISDPCGEFRH